MCIPMHAAHSVSRTEYVSAGSVSLCYQMVEEKCLQKNCLKSIKVLTEG